MVEVRVDLAQRLHREPVLAPGLSHGWAGPGVAKVEILGLAASSSLASTLTPAAYQTSSNTSNKEVLAHMRLSSYGCGVCGQMRTQKYER